MTHFVVLECVEKSLICMLAQLKHAEKKLVIDTQKPEYMEKVRQPLTPERLKSHTKGEKNPNHNDSTLLGLTVSNNNFARTM